MQSLYPLIFVVSFTSFPSYKRWESLPKVRVAITVSALISSSRRLLKFTAPPQDISMTRLIFVASKSRECLSQQLGWNKASVFFMLIVQVCKLPLRTCRRFRNSFKCEKSKQNRPQAKCHAGPIFGSWSLTFWNFALSNLIDLILWEGEILYIHGNPGKHAGASLKSIWEH